MENERLLDEDCNKIFNFWKLEEYLTPSDYPDLVLKVKEGGKDIPFDTYYNDYYKNALPLDRYKSHNQYLINKEVSEDKQYNRANIYCGCYKLKEFVEKMAEKCGLDLDKYAEISELKGRFYIFSVQIDLEGKITEEGVRVSPFFYAVVSMINAKGINVDVKKEDIQKLNEDINESLKQGSVEILKNFPDVNQIKDILFKKLEVESDQKIGLEGASEHIFACKGLKKEDKTSDFDSFYLDEIEKVHKDYKNNKDNKNNKDVEKYVTALLNKQQKVMIDSDIEAIKKWLEVDRFPLAKYPSKFSPTLMQQVAINIAISEKDRQENVFSVNGPPGTGKTTLLKEIIASNVEQLAEVLIRYEITNDSFESMRVESESGLDYEEKYYKIPEDIAKYGILVVSNNNGAVENVTLDLPKAGGMVKENTWTSNFDRGENEEIYFSKVADKLLGDPGSAWGLISARMGRKSYVSEVLDCCIFKKSNDPSNKVTLDLAKNDSISWETATDVFIKARKTVFRYREKIKEDKKILGLLYEKRHTLIRQKSELDGLSLEKSQCNMELDEVQNKLKSNEKGTLRCEEEIKHIKKHSSVLKKLLIIFHLGETGRHVAEVQKEIEQLVIAHGEIVRECDSITDKIQAICARMEKQNDRILKTENEIQGLEEKIYGEGDSLKNRYKNNLADNEFYENIKASEESQNSCPWTFDEYDKAREELFYAALQVRKAFILESPCIRRNLFVYEKFNNGKYTIDEKREMFPHLFNALAVVVPVLSSTFASVGRFLKYAGNKSLGMLVIDESGQAVPQSALGAIYRTKRAVVVGDPLQVEPVVTIPQVLIDILADSTEVPKEYKRSDHSVQTFADSMNEFNGMIGKRQVGCPLLVHRRCIEPMFSISNRISYDGRMFNKTNKKDEFLGPEQPFLLKKSGWIDVDGPEKGAKNHFVENQAEKVCQLLGNAMNTYPNLFETDDKIFIISPFRSVAESMRTYVIDYFLSRGFEKNLLYKWTRNCIGTVHTFQGKDANEVFLVLGCSRGSAGAMNWVVKNPNILNVACTRAKYRIAFIGNMNDWANRDFFNIFVPELIDKIDVC